MRLTKFLFPFIFFPIILSGQYSSYPWFYFDQGDTLTVSAKSGLKLRDSSSFDSEIIGFIPFGKSVIANGNYVRREVVENRNGSWLNVKYGELEGYIFSGFVTKLKIPEFGKEDLNCWNLQWFEKLIRENVDSLVCQGQKTYKGFDPDGKDWGGSNWEIFSDETVIYHLFGYETEDLLIESRVLNMNDILNLLEAYIDKVKEKCPKEQFTEEGSSLEIKVKLDEEGYIKTIECLQMSFIAEKSIHKTIIRLNLWNT